VTWIVGRRRLARSVKATADAIKNDNPRSSVGLAATPPLLALAALTRRSGRHGRSHRVHRRRSSSASVMRGDPEGELKGMAPLE